ncbi:hypothetical protein CDD83_6604 [Cordyceps sp. RAO-2017]|nr:hypothetical protein CDD83_6604 [Cordyceps sp. RAO-2017]
MADHDSIEPQKAQEKRQCPLDSAIPDHLRTERALPAKTPRDHQPPFPAYVARFPRETAGIVMAVIGAQYGSESMVDEASQAKLRSFVAGESAPPVADWASVVDDDGFYNVAVLAYWPSKEAHDDWAARSGFDAWWAGIEPGQYSHGWFLERLHCPIDRLETILSSCALAEGAANLRSSWSGQVRAHSYWGSMRDRLAAAQTDRLEGEPSGDGGSGGRQRTSGRVRVPGRKNLAVIRSGQDWSDTRGEERELYLKSIHPVLKAGMGFLSRDGHEVGCRSCRLMEIVKPETRKADTERTFGLAYFDDLASLESWVKDHPTHHAIFGSFTRLASKLQGDLALRLCHEVFVLNREDQEFVYIDCHPGTGMMGKCT